MRNKKKKYFSIILICSFIFLLISNFALSLDTGFQSPTIASNEVLTGSTKTWNNVDNSKSQSDSYAQVSLTMFAYSDYLRVVNFKFSIPESTIDGIIVEIDKYASNTMIRDNKVYLVLNGIIQGDNYALFPYWPLSDTDNYISYGSNIDDWNSDFTYNDVNDATFGIQISAIYSGLSSAVAFIDHIRIKIYYTIEEEEEENPPTFDTITESADPLELGETEIINVNVYDESNILHVYIEINSVNNSMTYISGDNWRYSTWTPTSVGIKTYQIHMIDVYNNINQTDVLNITVQDTTIIIKTIILTSYMGFSIFVLILLIVFMVYLYLRIKKTLPILVVFLFSLIIGVLSISSRIPFTPFTQIFFTLFQTIFFYLHVNKKFKIWR